MDIQRMIAVLRANEEIAKKLFEVEVLILSIHEFRDLLERLLSSIEEKFSVPYVWLSVVEKSTLETLMGTVGRRQDLSHRVNIIPLRDLLALVGEEGKPLLATDKLHAFYKLFPQDQKYLIKSIAVAPLVVDGSLVGSLNLADSCAERFHPDMDTFFLSQLAVKVSICLSNVMVREKLKLLASRDPLTGLLNRRELENVLSRELSRLRRHGGTLSILFLDCDDFKRINDSHGHGAGDKVLKKVADSLVSLVRSEDVVSRFGGDEFIVVLPGQGLKEAAGILRRIREHFKNLQIAYRGTPLRVGVSGGIAGTEEGLQTAFELIKKADQRLYCYKTDRIPTS